MFSMTALAAHLNFMSLWSWTKGFIRGFMHIMVCSYSVSLLMTMRLSWRFFMNTILHRLSWLVLSMFILSSSAFAQKQLSPGLKTANMTGGVLPLEQAITARNPRRHRRRTRRKTRRGRRSKMTVPIDIGLGPVLMLPNPALFVQQPAFTGLELSLAAIIDQQLIRKYKRKIPRQYRRMALSLKEFKYRPWYVALVPERLILSPALSAQGISGTGLLSTGMYGAVWRPLGFGRTLFSSGQTRFSLNLGLDLAYIFIHSADMTSTTHFLRPGLNLEAVLRVPVTKSFLFSMGWSSDIFIPQPLGEAPWVFWPLDQSLWHLGGPFIKLHFRVPYTVQL